MESVHNLAKSFSEVKNRRDEKRRAIDYDYAKALKELESRAVDVESRLRVLSFKNDIKNEEELFEQYDAELSELADELKPILVELNANRIDPLDTHLGGNVYLGTYLDEEGSIITGSAHRIG